MNKVQLQDIQVFANSFELANDLCGSSFLITGATGLIGSTMINCLLELNRDIHIIAPVRNRKKAESMLEDNVHKIELIECDLLSFDYSTIGSVDYVVHCAAPTSSKFFVEHPVETFDTIIKGTSILLEYAQKHQVKSFVYLSSLEVYGNITDDSKPITEDIQGYWDPMSIRSSYPIAKRAAENLCCLYSHQYDVPVKVARLTQTTGAGVSIDDNRIIAQFARMTAEGKDIILHTTGESARPYCYTIDAISAILYILLGGKAGEAYNVANEDTYISAREMAEFLKRNYNPTIHVRIDLDNNKGYAPVSKLRLSSRKIMKLGWRPNYGLHEMFRALINYYLDQLKDIRNEQTNL